MKSGILWKLLGVNVLVIGVVILIVWLAIDYLASNYFMTLMKEMHHKVRANKSCSTSYKRTHNESIF